jgi:hypothetical protein
MESSNLGWEARQPVTGLGLLARINFNLLQSLEQLIGLPDVDHREVHSHTRDEQQTSNDPIHRTLQKVT